MPAWSGLWNHEVGSAAGYTLPTRNPDLGGLAVILAKPGNRATAALFQAAIGAAAGANTALRQRRRVEHNVDGGVRKTELVTDINRVTTAADVTALKAFTTPRRSRPATYPKDLSGNGGPAFT